MDTELIHEYIIAKERKQRLKEELEEAGAKVEELKRLVLPQFQDASVASMNVAGRTVAQHRQVWARVKNSRGLASAFEAIGATEMVTETVNSHRLSAWVREFDPERIMSPEEIIQALPEEVREHIEVSEVIDLRVRS